jgi:decaprenylphospho-beta-D-erythro-pentofuranosid-2-ulose 2-reductase
MSSHHGNILIIGATSAIAEATARLWAAEGARLYLVGRRLDKLDLVAADLTARGARVLSALLDADDLDRHAAVVDAAFRDLGHVDIVLIAHGMLPDQRHCEQDCESMLRTLRTNAVSVLSLLTLIANKMEAQASGVIAVIGSVAGDRGRKSNYVYGSAKAMVRTFMEGLAGRMNGRGVRVIEIKPGFVDTPMTAAFEKSALWAAPQTVAAVIHAKIARSPSGSYYVPAYWRLIMLVIRGLPARILHRLNI